jgi:hypothetical protein
MGLSQEHHNDRIEICNMTEGFSFLSGTVQIEKDEEVRAVRSGGDFVPVWRPEKKSGAVHYLRFLTDATGIVQVAQHSSVKTKMAMANTKGPKSMNAICRYDKNFGEERIKHGLPKLYEDCYVCDNELRSTFGRDEVAKASPRCWALAVERELDPATKQFRDVMEEYVIRDDKGKPTDQKGQRPRIVIVNMGWSNYFQRLHNQWLFSSVDPETRTILDKDAIVRRSGEGTDVQYDFSLTPATPHLAPGTDLYKVYTDEIARREIDLNKIIFDHSTNEWMARWFDPTKTVNKEGEVVAAISDEAAAVFEGNVPSPEPVVSDAQAESMDTLRNRLLGN